MSKTGVSLYWNSYRYFPYEKQLAEREIKVLLQPTKVASTDDGLCVYGHIEEAQLKRLVYFSGYKLNGTVQHTLQHDLERSCTVTGSQRRQSTRYSVHGMHGYKGKFNPQVVRGVLNILGVSQDSKILDPFCGSGTTLVECSHIEMTAIGCDINPLAVYLSNVKLQALAIPEQVLRKRFVMLVNQFEKNGKAKKLLKDDGPHIEYLLNWFDEQMLLQIERLKSVIVTLTDEYKDIFLAIASDLIRDYSLQEPTDLRIRRRYTPFPEKPFWDAFKQKATLFLDNLATVQQVVGVKKIGSRAYLLDSRTLNAESAFPKQPSGYDAAITSPPYATALPYIDTQRLSLVWLDLLTPAELGSLEAALTGSREFVQAQKACWADALAINSKQLPANIHQYCLRLGKAVSKADGFRRQSVPSLLYRYLSDMQDVFKSLLILMRPSAPFALIVGHNRTTLGGKAFDIDTPALLRGVAKECGWQYEESIPLQTYQRYGAHMANAVRAETLLVVRKP